MKRYILALLGVLLMATGAWGQPYWENIGLQVKGASTLYYDEAANHLYASTGTGALYRNEDPLNGNQWVYVGAPVGPYLTPSGTHPHHFMTKANGRIYMVTTRGFHEFDIDNPGPNNGAITWSGAWFSSLGPDPTGQGVLVWKHGAGVTANHPGPLDPVGPKGPYRFDIANGALVFLGATMVDADQNNHSTDNVFGAMRHCAATNATHFSVKGNTSSRADWKVVWSLDPNDQWTNDPLGPTAINAWTHALGPQCQDMVFGYRWMYVQPQPGQPFHSYDLDPGASYPKWAVFVEPEPPENCHLIAGVGADVKCLTRPISDGVADPIDDWVSIEAGGGYSGNGDYAIIGNHIFYSHAKPNDGLNSGVFRSTRAWLGACRAGGRADTDDDGICDAFDNCPQAANAGQEDDDGDGLGNACDPCPQGQADMDGDGICDGADNCPDLANPLQTDSDGDGLGDLCEDDWDDFYIVEVSHTPAGAGFVELDVLVGDEVEFPADVLYIQSFDLNGDLDHEVSVFPFGGVRGAGKPMVITQDPDILAMVPNWATVRQEVATAPGDLGYRLIIRDGAEERVLDSLGFKAGLPYTRGQPAPLQDGSLHFGSVTRCGFVDDNGADYELASMTPGRANHCIGGADIGVVINEVEEVDMGTGQADQFVEILNVGDPIDLAGYWLQVLEELPGGQVVVVGDYWLQGDPDDPDTTLATGDRLVLAGADLQAIVPANTRFVDTGADQWLPGGTYGVRLLTVGQGDLQVLDTVAFEGPFVGPEGDPVHEVVALPADSPAKSWVSWVRCPDGTDNDNSGADFAYWVMSPGAVNACP